MEVSESFWMVIWDCNGLKLRNANSIFEVSARMFSKGFVDFQAWRMKGTHSCIYREGVWMDWRKRNKVLLQNREWIEACFGWTWGNMKWLCSNLAYTSDHFVLVPCIDLE